MMQYLVLETHPAYAVLLDQQGRFLKAANLRYTVGDRVTDIVEFQSPREGLSPVWKKSLASLSTLAACLCLVFFGYYQPNFSPYGTLRLQINPDVTLTLSRNDRVVGLEGGNQDGWDLIAGYDYHGKDRDTAADELVDRAMEMGYLSDGDTISVTVSSDDGDWQQAEEAAISQHLESKYGQTIVISLGPQEDALEEDVTVTIPLSPTQGDSGYGASDYGQSSTGSTGGSGQPTTPPPASSGDSGYQTAGDSGYGPSGNSGYETSGNSGYDDSGASNYDSNGASSYAGDSQNSGYDSGGDSSQAGGNSGYEREED